MPMLLLQICLVASALLQLGCCTPLTEAEKQQALDFHNHLRRKVVPPAADMNALGWDTRLEELAQRAADRCVFGHNYGPDYSGLGENLYSGWRRNFTEILMFMFLERELYDFKRARCVTGVGPYAHLKGCGHYLQIASAHVTRVGCAIKWCTDKYLAACEYNRYMTSPPYKTGDIGTKCEHSRCGYLYDKLCYCTASFMPTPPVPVTSMACKIHCLNNSTRVNDGRECRCQCLAGYSGLRCQTYYTTKSGTVDCRTQDIVCKNGGTPTLQDGSCRCKCAAGYRGDECEENIKLVDNSVYWYFGQQMRYSSYYPVSTSIFTNLPLSNALMYYITIALNALCKTNYRLCCPEATQTTSLSNFVDYSDYRVTPGYPKDAINGSLEAGVYFHMQPEHAAKCNLDIAPLVNRNALLKAARSAFDHVRTIGSYVGVKVPKME